MTTKAEAVLLAAEEALEMMIGAQAEIDPSRVTRCFLDRYDKAISGLDKALEQVRPSNE